MQTISLIDLAAEQLSSARSSSSGRSAHTVHGGRHHVLRQTLLALVAGHGMAEHENPGEATLQVLSGRVRITAGDSSWEAGSGDYLIVPAERHALTALDDSTALLTVVSTGTG